MDPAVHTATAGEKLSAVLQSWLRRNTKWCMSLAGGFMLGRIANAASSHDITSFEDLLLDLYSLHRPVNTLSWACSIALLGFPIISAWARSKSSNVRTLTLLATLAQKRIDGIIAPFARQTLAWGPELTLQLAPDLQLGWPLEQVVLRYDGSQFPFPPHRDADYRRFVKDNRQRLGLDQDGTKYALVKNPAAFSDADRLVLEIQRTKYSEVRYYGHSIATVPPERDKLIEEAIAQGRINFPSTLCMHAIVVTRDRRVLATKRSHKVAYAPDSWSVSVEEQLSPHDLRPGADGAVERWARRLLFEELAIGPEAYNSGGFRLLSVFLEADMLNCSVCAVLPIELSVVELDAVLKAQPRTDYEFTDWKFMTYPEMAAELRSPTLCQHPSMGYRILLALANRFGAARLADRVFTGSHDA